MSSLSLRSVGSASVVWSARLAWAVATLALSPLAAADDAGSPAAEGAAPRATTPAAGPTEPAAPGPQAGSAPVSRWKERPVALEAQLGIAGPLGSLGLAADISVNDYFALNAGVGLAATGQLQGALTPRLRLPIVGGFAIGLEGGLSGGGYTEFDPFQDPGERETKTWSFALWANTGASLELRTWHGFQLRLFGGIETPIYSTGGERQLDYKSAGLRPRGPTPIDALELGDRVIYLGLAVGAAF